MTAEPARHGTDHPAATVLPFPSAADWSRRRAMRGEKATMPVPPGPDLTPQQRLTAWLEGRFKAQQRTLTDDDTAEAFLITLTVMRTVLEGARAQGIIDEAQHRELDGTIAGMEQAPGLLR